MRVLVNPGDGVIIPEPCFVAYNPCAALAGAEVTNITTKAEDDFRLLPNQLKGAPTNAKVLLYGYPNNPTGAIMSRRDLEPIAALVKEKDWFVVSDEIYAELTYGGDRHVSIAGLEGMKNRTLLVSGFSKAFAMTGWRLGYACGPSDIINELVKLHSYVLMCSPTTAQEAAVEAMQSGEEDVARMVEQYDQRRRVILNRLRKTGLSCFEPRGAFYVFPCISGTGLTSEEFCRRLLEEEKVAVVPGTAFGLSGEGFVRMSYATSLEKIEEAMERISRFVERR